MGEVLQHDSALWARADQAAADIEHHQAKLIGAWLEFGLAVLELRRRHQDNQTFGAMCAERWPKISYEKRLGAMWWAGLNDDQRSTLIDEYPDSLTPATLRSRCAEYMPEWAKSDERRVLHSVQNEDKTMTLPENTQETPSEPAETTVEAETEGKVQIEDGQSQPDTNDGKVSTRFAANSPLPNLVGKQTALKILAYWIKDNTRMSFNYLAKTPGSRPIIKRMAELIPESTEPNTVSASYLIGGQPGNSFSHRLFVPGLPKGWSRHYGTTWNNIKAIKVILNQIEDARRMNAELGNGASIEQCLAWWKNRDKPHHQPHPQNTVVYKLPDTSAFCIASEHDHLIKPSAGSENEAIKVHGVMIWPNEHAEYGYEEAWAAWHLWQDLSRHMAGLKDDGHESRGRFLVEMKPYLNYASPKFANAFHKIASAEYRHPDHADDSCCPSRQFKVK